jgi:hypothetical protein
VLASFGNGIDHALQHGLLVASADLSSVAIDADLGEMRTEGLLRAGSSLAR